MQEPSVGDLSMNYHISANSFLPWIVSSIVFAAYWGKYSSFHYIRGRLVRQLFEIFYILKIQKRIVSAETICGNTVFVVPYIDFDFCL